jgi:ribonuclease HII
MIGPIAGKRVIAVAWIKWRVIGQRIDDSYQISVQRRAVLAFL